VTLSCPIQAQELEKGKVRVPPLMKIGLQIYHLYIIMHFPMSNCFIRFVSCFYLVGLSSLPPSCLAHGMQCISGVHEHFARYTSS